MHKHNFTAFGDHTLVDNSLSATEASTLLPFSFGPLDTAGVDLSIMLNSLGIFAYHRGQAGSNSSMTIARFNFRNN